MQRETLLLSMRPRFALGVLNGSKTAELRRVRPSAHPSQDVLIYSSSPTMALLGSAIVDRVESCLLEDMWLRVRDTAAVSRAEYDDYFAGTEIASAVWLRGVTSFERPIPLGQLRERWPWFRPPQSYCFVRATFAEARDVAALAPRFG